MQQLSGKNLRIVFMGTPELAAYCLTSLIEEAFTVVGVVTAPDKPSGRGRKLSQSAVKQVALNAGIPVLQPEKLKDPQFILQLQDLRPDLQVVVAFRMLPEAVWALPQLGTFNMHASLLPDYRGAAPINWVLINGETHTGVTTFMLNHQIDTGAILFREEITIDQDETAGSLHEKMKKPAAEVIFRTIAAIASGEARPIEQDRLLTGGTIKLNSAPKIFREHCRIDWHRHGEMIVNLVKGLSPSPGAYFDLGSDKEQASLQVKVYEAAFKRRPHKFPPGKMFSDNRNYMLFTTPDGVVFIKMLQLPGKKIMDILALLRGFQFPAAATFPF